MFSKTKKGDKVILLTTRFNEYTMLVEYPKVCLVEKVNSKTFSVEGKLFKIIDGKSTNNKGEKQRIVQYINEKDLIFWNDKIFRTGQIQKAFRLMRECATLNYKQAKLILEALENKKE